MHQSVWLSLLSEPVSLTSEVTLSPGRCPALVPTAGSESLHACRLNPLHLL